MPKKLPNRELLEAIRAVEIINSNRVENGEENNNGKKSSQEAEPMI